MIIDKGLDLQVRLALGMNQRQTGEFLGLSTRTIQRWDAGACAAASFHWEKLAKAIFPKDRELALRCAKMAGKTLDELGLVTVAAEPLVGPVAPELVIDALVCVAADAVGMLPGAIRPALVAAFTRARQLGITVEMAEKSLVGKPARAKR